MVILLLDEVYDEEQLHRYLAEKLHFPDYYGKNLSALHDCLGDAVLAGAEIRLHGTEAFLARFGEYGRKVLEIFAEFEIIEEHTYEIAGDK